MMNEFDGTNPLLTALGDEPTVRDVTIKNHTSFKIVEPLTGLEIETETVVRVHGEVAFQQIQKNIVQLNALKQQEAITSTDVIVEEQTPTLWELTNCSISNGVLAYSGGLMEKDGFFPIQYVPALFASKSVEAGEELLFTVVPSSSNNMHIAFDMGTRSGDFSDFSAVVKERSDPDLIQLFNGRTAPQGNIDATTLSGSYQISMKLQTAYVALLTIKDVNTQQELASLIVDVTQQGVGPFTRIWIYSELESTETSFNIPFTVVNSGPANPEHEVSVEQIQSNHNTLAFNVGLSNGPQ